MKPIRPRRSTSGKSARRPPKPKPYTHSAARSSVPRLGGERYGSVPPFERSASEPRPSLVSRQHNSIRLNSDSFHTHQSNPTCDPELESSDRQQNGEIADTDESIAQRIVSIFFSNGRLGAACFDLTTYVLSTLRETSETADCFIIRKLLADSNASKVITNLTPNDAVYEAIYEMMVSELNLKASVTSIGSYHFGLEKAKQRLFAVRTLYEDRIIPAGETRRLAALSRHLPLNDVLTIRAAGGLLLHLDDYAGLEKDTETGVTAVDELSHLNLDNMVYVDQNAYRALRIFHRDPHPSAFKRGMAARSGEREGLSLFSMMSDFCATKMGKQQLRIWFQRPTNDIAILNDRLNQIELFSQDHMRPFKDHVSHLMKNCESIIGVLDALNVSQIGYRGLVALYKTSYNCLLIWDACSALSLAETPSLVSKIVNQVARLPLERVCHMVTEVVDIQKSAAEKRIVVKHGVNATLDNLRSKYIELQGVLEAISIRECSRLKHYLTDAADIGMVYLPKFGYVLCVKKSHLNSNAIDYILPDLQLHDISQDVVMFRSEWTQRLDEEYGDIQCGIVERECISIAVLQDEVRRRCSTIRKMMLYVAELDAIFALAGAALRNGYVRPQLVNDQGLIDVDDGRHALQEALWISAGGCVAQQAANGARMLVANDVRLGGSSCRLKVIVGPNGSGKTVFIKQTGLIVFLAHVGSFVPARRARLGVIDALLTRMYSTDSVSVSLSSFMLDLNQIAEIVQKSTPRSLVLIDEFGKGSEVSNGVALLGSLLKHLLERVESSPLVLVATHFHSLRSRSLLAHPDRIGFGNMEVVVTPEENQEKMVYLFKLRDTTTSSTAAPSASRVNASTVTSSWNENSFALLVAKRLEVDADVLERAEQALHNMQFCSAKTALSACGRKGEKRIIYDCFRKLTAEFKQLDRQEGFDEFLRIKVVNKFRDLEVQLKRNEEAIKVVEEQVSAEIRLIADR